MGVLTKSRIVLGVGDDLLGELPCGPTGDVVLDGIGPEVFLAVAEFDVVDLLGFDELANFVGREPEHLRDFPDRERPFAFGFRFELPGSRIP